LFSLDLFSPHQSSPNAAEAEDTVAAAVECGEAAAAECDPAADFAAALLAARASEGAADFAVILDFGVVLDFAEAFETGSASFRGTDFTGATDSTIHSSTTTILIIPARPLIPTHIRNPDTAPMRQAW
jgi:hypothetical protein